MKPPRVLQVVLSLNPGGTERLVIELASRLHADIPMMVCCLDEPGSWARELEARDIAIVPLGRQPGFRPALGRAIATAARRHDATIIHAHHYSPFVYSCVARLWRPAARVIFTEHGRLSDAHPSSKRRAANQLMARCPHRVFAVSEDLRRHLVGEGFSPDAVDVIYNGIDLGPLPDPAARVRARARLGVSDTTFVIGTIARLDPVKDLQTLLRAVAAVAREINVVTAIIGDGPERPALERLASELQIQSHVRFLGQRQDAREWLAACDLYVNSSISEGVSLTILEAMAAGLPVLATEVGGTPEVVGSSAGQLVRPRDPDLLASSVLRLAREPAQRTALGRIARQRVESRFTLERMVREYRDVYLQSNSGLAR